MNTRHAPSVPVSFSQGNNESAKMPMLRCAIVATSVIVSVQVDPKTRNDQVVRLIQLKTNIDGPPHALELFVATPVGHTTIGLPTYHPDYKLLDRGHIQTMKRYLTSDSRLSLTSTPDDGASPSIAESCDTLPKERQLCSLLLGGYLWLETPYRDDQLVKELGNLDHIKRIVKLTGFVNCVDGFTAQPAVINGASDLLVQIFGDKGKHARSAVGTNALPLNVAVEIEAIVEVDPSAPSKSAL
ncbi:hypothetical protein Poli38472_010416 [Pythium oligandrum]|uniref:Endoribonuclease L-PSP/chorismate mutase-like domain-containing protein n=1 Tax=Pythium oligandrum TaxID=41045 RepID=A0A8K1C342_PYTOL|nr:hypothetical protein Poli38472_010416 [Pythium oligandrum]|eukprot:TMW55534.1 hypothetical protein Poli38472_010416 [Pythium oligandrum]